MASERAPPPAPPPPAHPFSVQVGAPQRIKLCGFRDVFERHRAHLASAVCHFGPDGPVGCTCDVSGGTMQCDVPKVAADDDGGCMVVRAKIAGFETPNLLFRYVPPDHHNALLFAADVPQDALDVARSRSLHAAALRCITRERRRKSEASLYGLVHQCFAECIGTMLIVIFGVGSVCSAVLTGYAQGLWQVAVVWGFGVALAICTTASVSGAHLNPAVSLALALFRPSDFPLRKLLPYWVAQYTGGILGGAFNLMVYGPQFRHYEAVHNIVRGDARSIATASAFGEYFPNPGFADVIAQDVISAPFAMMIEAWGTAILMFVILALTDPRQKLIRNKEMIPFYIGFTVAILISLYAPLTQAGWNPARDFGPRLVAAAAGWGRIAIPGPRGGFWIYIVGPKIGAPLGALVYDLLINPGLTD